uniref:RNase H type-1 domain-containing protein n=1 Tax=Oryza glumipatula TaxID=40148 RepID=A0A0D9YUV6_9ORYZ
MLMQHQGLPANLQSSGSCGPHQAFPPRGSGSYGLHQGLQNLHLKVVKKSIEIYKIYIFKERSLVGTTVSSKDMPIMNSFIDIFENFVQYNNEIYFRQWEHSRVSGWVPQGLSLPRGHSALEAELLACKEGIARALQWTLVPIIIESDCLAAINMIQTNQRTLRTKQEGIRAASTHARACVTDSPSL